jgi:hypothetical protein
VQDSVDVALTTGEIEMEVGLVEHDSPVGSEDWVRESVPENPA